MGKTAKSKPRTSSSAQKRSGGINTGWTFFAIIIPACLAVIAAWWQMSSRDESSNGSVASHEAKSESGVGPQTMAGHASLINRLMTLLQEVDELKGDENRAERMKVSSRLEDELKKIEKEVDPSTADGKQGAALIALVRSALQSDRDGVQDVGEDWSEEKLLEEHGLLTYASREYWDDAYGGNKYGGSYDWYSSWATPDADGNVLGNILRPFLKKDDRILMLGCGNSNMSSLMYADGYEHITNVDVVEVVIDQMRELYKHQEKMTWHATDAAAMTFDKSSFDVVIEKGLFDALYAGTGSQVGPVLKDAVRVLRSGGQFLTVTFGEDRTDKFSALLLEAGVPQLECKRVGRLATTGKGVFVFSCVRP